MLLEKLLELLKGWAPAFCQQRTCKRAIALALGLLYGLGRRTLTRALCFHHRQHRDWSADYRLFSRSRWDPKALFAPVLQTEDCVRTGMRPSREAQQFAHPQFH